MPVDILMPALSPTMTEGKLAKWLKKEGDPVKSGDLLAEIETDKATMEYEAVDEGVIGKILVPDGTEGVKVNAVIAVLLTEGEDKSAIGARAAAPAPKPASAPAPAAVAPAPAAPVAAQPAATPSSGTSGRVFASPLARRIAKEKGLDLAQLTGSGPHGRIVRADVEQAQHPVAAKPAVAATPTATAPVAPPPVPAFGPAYEEIPLTSMRKTIARRMADSKGPVPHFYLTVDFEIDQLLKVRKDLNDRSDKYKLSVNDFVIRACALALKKRPDVNSSFADTHIRRYKEVDISVAVAIPGGLITPIIKNADQKGLAQISQEMKELAGRAKEGKLKPEEYNGGGFSVSNLGMFGIREFDAIINPPQGAILAVGAGEQRPIVKNGALTIATIMTCTLSVDHRVIDGATGAEFMQVLKPLIEDPLAMLL